MTSATLSLTEAAALLHLHPETLRERVKAGTIPGAKIGKAWIFIREDLLAHVRSLYAVQQRAAQVTSQIGGKALCHSFAEVRSGGFHSPRQPDKEYAAALGLPTR